MTHCALDDPDVSMACERHFPDISPAHVLPVDSAGWQTMRHRRDENPRSSNRSWVIDISREKRPWSYSRSGPMP
jgi:hypothetical protein